MSVMLGILILHAYFLHATFNVICELEVQSMISNESLLVKFNELLLAALKLSILCVHSEKLVLVHSPGSVKGKQT